MRYISFVIFSLSVFSCSSTSPEVAEGKVIEITTQYGQIELLLYSGTAHHSENFIKLIESGYFNNLLFHRVIKGFMVQGGDPLSRNAKAGTLLGTGGPDYTLPAEFNSAYFHKRGALAAAREGDMQNPEQRSSGSQFYIVTGKTFTDDELNRVENQIYQSHLQNKYLRYYMKAIASDTSISPSMASLVASDSISLYSKTSPRFKFTSEQREIYKTIGGAPHLDGSYTVFGEVIKGMEVLDKISSVPTDQNDRPLSDIIITIKVLN